MSDVSNPDDELSAALAVEINNVLINVVNCVEKELSIDSNISRSKQLFEETSADGAKRIKKLNARLKDVEKQLKNYTANVENKSLEMYMQENADSQPTLSFILDQINRLEQKLNKLSVEISQNENNEKSKRKTEKRAELLKKLIDYEKVLGQLGQLNARIIRELSVPSTPIGTQEILSRNFQDQVLCNIDRLKKAIAYVQRFPAVNDELSANIDNLNKCIEEFSSKFQSSSTANLSSTSRSESLSSKSTTDSTQLS